MVDPGTGHGQDRSRVPRAQAARGRRGSAHPGGRPARRPSLISNSAPPGGDTARVRCYAMAQHYLPQEGPGPDRTRHALMMNRYDADLTRDGRTWRISRLTIDNAWFRATRPSCFPATDLRTGRSHRGGALHLPSAGRHPGAAGPAHTAADADRARPTQGKPSLAGGCANPSKPSLHDPPGSVSRVQHPR